VAPDKFRETLSAEEAARAVAAGWRRGDPSAEVEELPVADGGEGTLDALVAALGGERLRATVTGPLGDPVLAEYALCPGARGPLGVVEMARASGLALVPAGRRDPKRTTTEGTGELILAACRGGARSVLVCVGGSATNDAGAGAARAMGIRVLDRSGLDLPPGGGALRDLNRSDRRGLAPGVRGVPAIVACDVDNPLTGPQGAAAVYGPQKGAGKEDVELLDRALTRFAVVARRDLGVDLDGVAGAGAAGGLGGGLLAFLGADLRPGAEVVLEAVGLADRLATADLVITGEGSFDRQSLRGKAPAGVLRAASAAGVPAIVLCGRAEARPPGVRVEALADRFGADAAMGRAAELLERLAQEIAEETAAGGPVG